MRVSSGDIQRLAERIVDAMIRQGNIKPQVDAGVISARVAALIQKNLEDEASLEQEAERIADSHARQMSGMDQRRVIQLIMQKLADERGFPL